MATGDHGEVGLPVQHPAMEELTLGLDFATIRHLPMEEQHAREQALRLHPAMSHLAEQVKNIYF